MLQGRLRVLLLMMTDALTLSACGFVAVALYGWCAGVAPDWRYASTRGGFVAVYLCLNVFGRLYHGNPFYPGMALPAMEEFRRLTLSTVGTGALFFAYLSFFAKASPFPPWVVLLAVGLNVLAAQSARNAVRRCLLATGGGRLLRIPVVLLGPRGLTGRLEGIFARSTYAGVRVAGAFERTQEALAFAMQGRIAHCVCCQPLRVFKASLPALLDYFSVVVCMPEWQVFPVALSRPVEFGGYGALEMANQLHQRGTRAVKRVAELALAALAMALCLAPGLCIMVALWATVGREHIFYRTTRLGKRGRPFTCWKFRTMAPGAEARLRELLAADPELAREWRETGKLRDDPRVTRLGAWLRKTSLDEIPQLWNVLRREMALIGPRPIVEAEVAKYGAAYAVVSSVKPGITGLWQVSGRSDVDYDTRVALDSYYAQNWSLWLDLWIFLRTFAVVLLQRGAY